MPPSPSPAPGPRTAWILAVTLAIQALASAATLAPAVVGPAVTRDLGLSTATIGVYMALVYLGAIFTSVAGSTLVARFGPVRCSQFALLGCGLGIGMLSTGSLPWAVPGALLIGIGYGPITPSSSFLLMRTTPRQQLALVFSIKQTGVPIGGVLAALAVPQIEAALGWRPALAALAAACLLCALLAQSVRRNLDQGLEAPPPWSWADLVRPVGLVWRDRPLRVMAFCSLVFSAVQLAVTAFLITYLNLALGWTLIAAGVMLSVAQASGVAFRVVWGVVADRWMDPRVLLGLLSVLMAACCVGAALLRPATPGWAVGLLVAAFGASAIAWNGVFLAEVARNAPGGKVSQATGGTLLFTYFGVLAGQPAFGFIASATGSQALGNYPLAYAVLALPALACAAALLHRRGSR